jgi:hypothetical protein
MQILDGIPIESECEMSKRETKYGLIRSNARERLEVARSNVETAERQLGLARAAFNAHKMAYYALERELAPKPRKRAEKPATSTPAAKEPTAANALKCGTCGNVKDHADHDRSYIKSHDFEPPKSVARAARKSSKKITEAQPDQSSEIETVAATDAAIAASSGD